MTNIHGTGARLMWGLRLSGVTMALLGLSACSHPAKPVVNEADAIELRVMTFNIEWGGTNVSFDNVVEAIRLADADIVGIQEAEGNLARLAAELGWNHDLQNYALSRHPIWDAPGAERRFVLVEVRPGEVVALANVHLPSDPYGPDLVRDGASEEQVIELERTVRLPAMTPFLEALAPVVRSGMPVFLTGDFNAPSHADWTEAMVGVRSFLRYTVDWPVSRAVENAGFEDSWRAAHPDPETHPGLTWWAGRPPLEAYAPGENDPQDRIDFVWAAGSTRTLSSALIGEPGARDVWRSVSPWPSDHRAVVSTFSVRPAPIPRLVSPSARIYGLDDEVVIAYRNASRSELDIAGHGSEEVDGDGERRFPAGELPAGHYEVALRTPGGDTIQSDFWVLDRSAAPTVEVSRDRYEVGEAIDIKWRNGPGNRNDYLGVYAIDVESAYIPGYDGGLTWLYVNALPEGSMRLDEGSSETGWPLPPGRYVLRLLKDDGYEVLAESPPFEVR